MVESTAMRPVGSSIKGSGAAMGKRMVVVQAESSLRPGIGNDVRNLAGRRCLPKAAGTDQPCERTAGQPRRGTTSRQSGASQAANPTTANGASDLNSAKR